MRSTVDDLLGRVRDMQNEKRHIAEERARLTEKEDQLDRIMASYVAVLNDLGVNISNALPLPNQSAQPDDGSERKTMRQIVEAALGAFGRPLHWRAIYTYALNHGLYDGPMDPFRKAVYNTRRFFVFDNGVFSLPAPGHSLESATDKDLDSPESESYPPAQEEIPF